MKCEKEIKRLRVWRKSEVKLAKISAVGLALMSMINDVNAQVEYFGSTVGGFTANTNGEGFTADILNGSTVVASLTVNISNLTGAFDSNFTSTSTTTIINNDSIQGGVIILGEPNNIEPLADPEEASSADVSISIGNVATGYKLSGLSVTSNRGVSGLDSLTNIVASNGAEFIEAAGGVNLALTPGFADGIAFALPNMINFNENDFGSINGFRAAEHSNQWAINAVGVNDSANVAFTYNTTEVNQLFVENLFVTATVVAVPEPSSSLLIGVFGIGSLCYRKRK